MMMRDIRFLLLILLTAVTGCTLLPTEAGIIPTATPVGDMITFSIPVYSASLRPGDSISGAPMRYIDHNRDIYTVEIEGQRSEKRAGDSFAWQGLIAPGVFANYNLRLTANVFDDLPITGSAEFLVLFPEPRDAPFPADRTGYIAIDDIAINYFAPVGREIPGTTYIYDGVATQGQGNFTKPVAQISNSITTKQYASNDSFTEIGAVTDNVYVQYNLRVVGFDEENMHLLGTATLWIDPTPKK